VSFAHQPLILHAAEIPPTAAAAHQELDAFVTKVLSYAPEFPSHLGHPQWDYHWPDFMKIRHAYLSNKLGARTELEPPPAGMLAIDRLWWRLDGAEKAHVRRLALLKGRLEQIDRELSEYAAGVLNELATPDLAEQPAAGRIFAEETLKTSPQSADAHLGRSILNAIEIKLAAKREEAERRKAKLHFAIAAAELEYDAGEHGELRKARSEYERLLQRRVKSAGIPIIHWRTGAEREPDQRVELAPPPVGQPLSDIPWFQVPLQSPQETLLTPEMLSAEAWPRGLAREAYYRIFGRWPHVSVLSPFWSCAQPLLAAIEAAKAGGARDALLVVDTPGAFLGQLELPGKIAHVSPAGLESELFHKALEPHKQFDLCVVQLSADDFPRLSELLGMLEPYMRPGGTIVGFYMYAGRPVDTRSLDVKKSRVAFTGSVAAMRAIRLYSAAFNRFDSQRVLGAARGMLMLACSIPLVLWANAAEAAAARKGRLPVPALRTSATIIVRDM